MKSKSILIIIIVVILAIIGVMAFTSSTNDGSQVKVGDATFKMPSGFHEGASNSAGDVNITNGYDTVFIKEHNTNNITQVIKEYKKYKHKENRTVKITNSTINNIPVYKSDVKNESYTIHYWFVYNDKVYSIYTWGGDSNFDSIATDLINSLN